jgi:hypothetical protein
VYCYSCIKLLVKDASMHIQKPYSRLNLEPYCMLNTLLWLV